MSKKEAVNNVGKERKGGKFANLFPPEHYRGLAIDEFAQTGDTGGRRFCLWDLAAAKAGNFKKIFKHSLVPREEDLRGHTFKGNNSHIKFWFFGKFIFSLYVGKLRDVLTGKLFSQPLTFQKRLLDEDMPVKRGKEEGVVSGINYWCRRGRAYLPFKIYVSPAVQDKSLESLKIDYNVVINKWIFHRPLIDEIRRLPDSDLYLGRMYFRLGPFSIPFIWFGIEKIV
ncbi:MAG: hypothetical protein KAW12_05060 [Candidatus Aminicenantes bacterium]|nr:hypothetical protein [Candidatus Aminicenantes bacterium]